MDCPCDKCYEMCDHDIEEDADLCRDCINHNHVVEYIVYRILKVPTYDYIFARSESDAISEAIHSDLWKDPDNIDEAYEAEQISMEVN